MSVDLEGCNITNTNFRGVNMHTCKLSGAYIHDVKIKKAMCFSGLYRYMAMPVIGDDNTEWIQA